MKEKLIQKLWEKGILWSYAPLKELPDEIIIEHTLRYMDIEEVLLLFKIFPKNKIRKIWQQKLIPDSRIRRLNYYLAIMFFNIRKPSEYLDFYTKKYSRYARCK